MKKMYYEPLKLINAMSLIRQAHNNASDAQVRYTDSEKDNKTLILKISSMTTEQATAFADVIALQKRKLRYLTEYIFFNKYNVDMTNIFLMLRLKMTDELWLQLFEKWQMYYTNNNKIIYMLHDSLNKSNVVKNTDDCLLSQSVIGNWIDSVAIEETVVTDLVLCMCSYNATFEKACEMFLLNKNSSLITKSKAYYYSVCSADMLIADGDEKIAEVMRSSKTDIQRKIILNCLKNIPAECYSEYTNIWSVIVSACGKINEKKYTAFFANTDYICEQNYRVWYSICELDSVFGYGDARSIFWRRKCIENRTALKLCRFYTHNKAILMQFNNIYIIEFKEKNGGAVYIIKGDYYNNIIRSKFENYNINMVELKSYLYNLRGYTYDQMVRHTHHDWQYKVTNTFNRFMNATS